MRAKTDMLDVASRKLTPYILLFGAYLISNGHLSPGGGFQGGVVLASGLILPAMGCRRERMKDLLSNRVLEAGEALGFLGIFVLGLAGMLTAGAFLADPFPHSEIPHAWFIFLLNLAIGLKVGAGIGLLGLLLIRTFWDDEQDGEAHG